MAVNDLFPWTPRTGDPDPKENFSTLGKWLGIFKGTVSEINTSVSKRLGRLETRMAFDLKSKAKSYYTSQWPTFAQLLTAIGSNTAVVYVNSTVTLTADTTVPANVSIRDGGGLFVLGDYDLTINGPFDWGLRQAFSYTGTGVALLGESSCDEIPIEWFGAITSATDNTDEVNAAMTCAAYTSGATRRVGAVVIGNGAFDCTGQLNIPTRNLIIRGHGADVSVLRYSGTTYQDFMVGDTGGEGFLVLKDFGLRCKTDTDGETLLGKGRYLLSLGNFNENCIIDNVQLRNSVGLIKILQGYLCTIRNLRAQVTARNTTIGGITHAQWLEVWDDGHAPIDLAGMNAATIDSLTTYRVGSETSSGATADCAILLKNSAPASIRAVQIEQETSDSLRLKYGIRLQGMDALLENLYFEGNYFTNHFIYATTSTRAKIDGMLAFDFDCESDMFRHAGIGELQARGVKAYKARTAALYKVNQSGFSVQGKIEFDACAVTPGNLYRQTIANSGPNDDQENILDTYGMASANLRGIKDEDDLNYSFRRVITPRKLTGLTVTYGASPVYDTGTATGSYVQMTGGVFLNEAGKIIIVKRQTDNANATNLALMRLRPNNTSGATRYYRLFIGEAGNYWLTEYTTLQSDPKGNWLAEFTVNSSGTITAQVDNPRLSLNGLYTPNHAGVMVMDSAVPASAYYQVGDFVRNIAPSASTPFGWICITAGVPSSATNAVFQTVEDPTFIKLAKSVDGVWEAQRFVNEESTASSTNEIIRHHYRFRGGGSASDRTAGYFEMRKDGDFGSAGAMDGRFVFAPSIDETPTDMLGIDQNGIDFPTAGKRFRFQEGPVIRAGSGTPEGAVVGSPGDFYLRNNGGAGTSFYVKESGTSTNTGWVAK